jgi:hypothetical protein
MMSLNCKYNLLSTSMPTRILLIFRAYTFITHEPCSGFNSNNLLEGSQESTADKAFP